MFTRTHTYHTRHSRTHTHAHALNTLTHARTHQAMLEYEGSDAAATAVQALSGADIYTGCCTLKIEFSRTEKLNVRGNTEDTRDFTMPGALGFPPPAPIVPAAQAHAHAHARTMGQSQQSQLSTRSYNVSVCTYVRLCGCKCEMDRDVRVRVCSCVSWIRFYL